MQVVVRTRYLENMAYIWYEGVQGLKYPEYILYLRIHVRIKYIIQYITFLYNITRIHRPCCRDMGGGWGRIRVVRLSEAAKKDGFDSFSLVLSFCSDAIRILIVVINLTRPKAYHNIILRDPAIASLGRVTRASDSPPYTL